MEGRIPSRQQGNYTSEEQCRNRQRLRRFSGKERTLPRSKCEARAHLKGEPAEGKGETYQGGWQLGLDG